MTIGLIIESRDHDLLGKLSQACTPNNLWTASAFAAYFNRDVMAFAHVIHTPMGEPVGFICSLDIPLSADPTLPVGVHVLSCGVLTGTDPAYWPALFKAHCAFMAARSKADALYIEVPDTADEEVRVITTLEGCSVFCKLPPAHVPPRGESTVYRFDLTALRA